jgi:hypothetical protein
MAAVLGGNTVRGKGNGGRGWEVMRQHCFKVEEEALGRHGFTAQR